MSAYTKSREPLPHCLSIRWLLAYYVCAEGEPVMLHTLAMLAGALNRLAKLAGTKSMESLLLAAIEYDFMQHHKVSSIDKLRTVLLCDDLGKTSNVPEEQAAAEQEMYNTAMVRCGRGHH